MKYILKLKKFFGLLIVQLLLLQPVLLGASSSRSESANSRLARIRAQKAQKNTTKPAAQPTANSATSTAIKSTVPTQQPVAEPVQADDADARQARSVSSARKETKSSFEKNVESYVIKIKNTYGLKEASVKPFVDAIHKINNFQKNSNNNILSHVKKAIEPLKSLAPGNQAITKSEAQQQLGMALLLKATMPLGLQAQEIICEMLHKLDNYISYWREQKHHQISYYFHKNPQKWFSSQKQKKEIEDNLHLLKSVHDDHLRWLAKLAEHESLFNQSASLKDQYVWIADYLSLISNICYGSQAKLGGIAADESMRFEKLRMMISDMLSKAPAHERNVARALGDAKKPGHFMRNWIAYSGLAIGSVALAWYAHTHHDRFHARLNEIQKGLGGFFAGAFDSGRDLYETIMGKANDGPPVDFDQVQRDIIIQLDTVQRDTTGIAAGTRGVVANIRENVQPRLNNIQQNIRDEVLPNLNRLQQNIRANNPRNPITQAEALQQCQAAVAHYQQTRNELIQQNVLAPGLVVHNLDGAQFADLEPEVFRALEGAIADFGHMLAQIGDVGEGPEQANIAQAREGLGWFASRAAGDHAPVVNNFMRDTLPVIMRIANRVPDAGRITEDLLNLSRLYALLIRMTLGDLLGAGGGLVGGVSHVTGAAADLVGGMSQVVGAGADGMQNMAAVVEGIASTVGQVPQVRNVDGVNVPVMQVDANNQPILDANGQQIPVMVPGPLRAGLTSVIDLTKKADRLLTQNQATIILAALIPAGVLAGGTLWGANKLYKTFKHKPDFQPMREALVYIGHLLNEEGLEKKDEQAQLDQGLVLYLVWKLKREAENVPVLLRDQFLADVSKLGRSDLDTDKKRVWTADKKLQVIDLMYRTYDFLNPMYVVQ